MSFYDFDEYERLVAAAKSMDSVAYLIVLRGEAGLRCGEMIALEWSDVDLGQRQLCVQRSDWNGQMTMPKGGRLHAPESGRARQRDSAAGSAAVPKFSWRYFGDGDYVSREVQ
jgi:integrase